MEQPTLFTDAETFSNKRPAALPEKEANAFWLKMANEVIDERWSDSDEEDIAEDLKGLYMADSGFEMAKDLEHGGADYEFTSGFIAWLENLWYEKQEAYNEVVAQWVKAKNPQPQHATGTELTATANISREIKKDTVFYITGIKAETACYLVHPDKNWNGGYIIAYEVIEEKSTPVTEADNLESHAGN